MKRTLMGLLLLVFVADSLIHPLLFSAEYVVIQKELSELEKQLSNDKASQIGHSQAIIVLNDNSRNRGDIYSQNFFTEEINGQTISYTIVDSVQLIDFQKITKKNNTDPFSSDNHNLFLKIQKDLFCQDLIQMDSEVLIHKKQSQSTGYLNPKTDILQAVQTPPPNFRLS